LPLVVVKRCFDVSMGELKDIEIDLLLVAPAFPPGVRFKTFPKDHRILIIYYQVVLKLNLYSNKNIS